jgi:hypothetical protein
MDVMVSAEMTKFVFLKCLPLSHMADDAHGRSVCTPGDLDTYTHILYLDVPAELIVEYRKRMSWCLQR